MGSLNESNITFEQQSVGLGGGLVVGSIDIIHHARKGYQYRKTLWDAGSILPLSFIVCVRMRVCAECVCTCMCVHVCAACGYKSMETRPEPDGFGQIFRNDAGVVVGSVTSGRKLALALL